MLFDAHSDFGIHIYRQHMQGNESSLVDSHFKALIKGNVKIEVLTVGGDFTLGGIDFRETGIVPETIKTVKKQLAESELSAVKAKS